ncbi:ABC transporter permease [Pseudonocardia acaciae]|uniref:ABC transporter permease n=1 Tax=Pseudonocardia acaciae TaxID=551276 RepID=UPI0009FCD885|nr:iron ABC transporter permease [Pseudonocardia acaciae]
MTATTPPAVSMLAPARPRRPRAARVLLAAACAAVFLWPVVMVAVGAFRTSLPGTPGGWTVTKLVDTYLSPVTYQVLAQTVFFAVSVTVVSTLLALFFAWVVARTDTPLRRLVTPMMGLVLAMPPLFFAISWGMLGNQRVGLLNTVYQWLTGAGHGFFNVESWFGLILVSSLKAASFSYFLLLGPFLTMDRSLEEASLTAGAGRARTFFRVQLPLLTPAISGAAFLTMLAFLEAFDIPEIIGIPAGIRVLPTQIYSHINATYGGQYAEASSLAMCLMLIILALVAVRARLLGGREFTTVSGKSYRLERWKLGRARWLGTGGILGYGLLALVLPLAQLYLGSLQSLFGRYDGFSLDNYAAVLDDAEITGAIRDTALLAVLGGLVTVVVCTGLAAVLRTRGGLAERLVTISVWMPMALPGIVLGLGIMWSFLSVPGLNQLYATIWILLVGLFIGAVPVGMRAAEGALAQIPRDLEEAARIGGASRVRAFAGVVVPLIVPSLLSGWLLVAIMISGNLAIPVLLASPTSQTVSVEVLKLYQSGEISQAAAVFCVISTAMAAVGVVVGVVRAVLSRRTLLRGTG